MRIILRSKILSKVAAANERWRRSREKRERLHWPSFAPIFLFDRSKALRLGCRGLRRIGSRCLKETFLKTIPRGSTPRQMNSSPEFLKHIRRAEVRREFSIDLDRTPIDIAPDLKFQPKLPALLGCHRERRAIAVGVDCNIAVFVELETMSTWSVLQPSAAQLEIAGLSAKGRDHRTYI